MASEYSYYSEDEHHDKNTNKNRQMKSGMTEQDVVPKNLPAEINESAQNKKEQEKGEESDDWSEQMREANEKSAFTKPKTFELLHNRTNSEQTEPAQVQDSEQNPFFNENAQIKVHFADQAEKSSKPPKSTPQKIKTVIFKPPTDEDEKPQKMNANLIKLLSRQQASKSGSLKPPLVTQSTDHRLMYLNPKERARRDLENRHGSNIVKMAQASADRLNSTLESQIQNLGVSLGRSTTSIHSLLATPDRRKNKAFNLMVQEPVAELDVSLDRASTEAPEIQKRSSGLNLDLNMNQSMTSTNRRLNHLTTKHKTLQKKIKNVKLFSSASQRSMRSNSKADLPEGQARASRHPVESAELVQKMIEYDPEKAQQLYEIQSKPKMILTEEELQLEQVLLSEKLKAVNKNLNRIVNKEMISKQSAVGKEKNQQALAQKQRGDCPVALELVLLDKKIDNTKARKQVLKTEFYELQGKMTKHLSDPEANDKLILQLSYLDNMIKGEYIQIKNLNEKINAFVKYDFTQKEVDGERKLVQIEDELMRIRIKDETIKLVNMRNEKQCQEYEVKIAKAEAERQKLAAELVQVNKNIKIRNLKPMLAQKFLGDAFHKMKDSVEFEYQTAKARTSVHNIKMYQFKTQSTQTKQKIVSTKQSIEEVKSKIKSTQVMLKLLEEERFNQKRKQTFGMEEASNLSPDDGRSPTQLPPKKYTPSMKPPVPNQQHRRDNDRVEDSELSMRNIRPLHQHSNSQQDLNLSQAFNPQRRLSSAQRSDMNITSKSLMPLNSHRSNVSKQSLEKLERGWSSKFQKAKALQQKQVNPLARPFSSKQLESGHDKEPETEKKGIPPAKTFTNKEKMEFRNLTRRFGNQPANFSQVKKQKVHDLVDDRENDPADRSSVRGASRSKKPGWDHRNKPNHVSLPQLVSPMEKSKILRGSASVDRYQRMMYQREEDEEDVYPANRQANYIKNRYQDKNGASSNPGTPKRLAGTRLKFPEARRSTSNVRDRPSSLDPVRVIYRSNYQSASRPH